MISVVMTNHNRRVQLLNTLKSIEYFCKNIPIEVIVVDDTDKAGESINGIELSFDIPIVVIPVKDKDWTCSCVAYNAGFNVASGDIVIIQNSECAWMGDIAKYATDNLHDGLHITFGAYSLGSFLPEIKDFAAEHQAIRTNIIASGITYLQGRTGWFNHSLYRPCKYHFCAALTKSDLEKINGFDERYQYGIAHDDVEILIRIANAGIETVIVNEPFVVHQLHENHGVSRKHPLWQKNFQLYNECTLKENLVKPPQNKVYVR